MFCSLPDLCTERPHWCPACKYAACPDCCGCDECRAAGIAGCAPQGTPAAEQRGHGGKPLRPRGNGDAEREVPPCG